MTAYLSSSLDPVYLNDKRLDCLIYADDVILLSSSSAGLQSKLDLLQAFCEDWCLSITIDKTKVVIFNKAGRLINSQSYSILIRLYLLQQLISILVYHFLLLVHLLQPKSNFTINQLKLCIY